MAEKIIILDFGSQVTQLIGRRLRELNVYCEIYPFNKVPALDSSVKGVILSGSPCSVRDKNAPQIDLGGIKGRFPLLGICYGAQYLAHKFGGEVLGSLAREYGRAMLDVVDSESPLLKGVSAHSQVWMSHGDTIARLPEGAEVIASTESVTNAAFTSRASRPTPCSSTRRSSTRQKARKSSAISLWEYAAARVTGLLPRSSRRQ